MDWWLNMEEYSKVAELSNLQQYLDQIKGHYDKHKREFKTAFELLKNSRRNLMTQFLIYYRSIVPRPSPPRISPIEDDNSSLNVESIDAKKTASQIKHKKASSPAKSKISPASPPTKQASTPPAANKQSPPLLRGSKKSSEERKSNRISNTSKATSMTYPNQSETDEASNLLDGDKTLARPSDPFYRARLISEKWVNGKLESEKWRKIDTQVKYKNAAKRPVWH